MQRTRKRLSVPDLTEEQKKKELRRIMILATREQMGRDQVTEEEIQMIGRRMGLIAQRAEGTVKRDIHGQKMKRTIQKIEEQEGKDLSPEIYYDHLREEADHQNKKSDLEKKPMKQDRGIAERFADICKEIKCKPVSIEAPNKPKQQRKKRRKSKTEWKKGDYVQKKDEFSPIRQPYNLEKGKVTRAKKRRSEVAYQILYNKDRFPGLILRYLTEKGFYRSLRFPLKSRTMRVVLGEVLMKTQQLMDDGAMVVKHTWWDDEDMEHLCNVLEVRPITLFTDTIPMKEQA